MPRIISNNLGKFLIALVLILVVAAGFSFFKNLSATYPMVISLKGLSLGPLMVSFKTLVLFLLSFLLLGIIALGLFIYRVHAAKKILRKETREAKESLRKVFMALREEVKEQVELFDTRPGFNEQEKKVGL